MNRNLLIASARYQVDASRAARLIAHYKPNPVVTMGSEQWALSPGHLFQDFWHTSDIAAQSTTTFRVDKIIERGGKRELRTDQAESLLSWSEAQMLDTVRNQLFQLREAFTAALLARENQALAELANQQYEQTETLTAVKVQKGESAGSEIYRVRAGRLLYQQAVLQAQSSYEQAVRDVLNLLGVRTDQVSIPPSGATARNVTGVRPVAAQTVAAPPETMMLELVGSLDAPPMTKTLPEMCDLALANRPDVLAARHLSEAAASGVRLAQAGRKRDISIGVEYQRIGSDNTLGVVAQIPLFLYNNQKTAIAQAEAQRLSAEALARQAENQAMTEVGKAYQSYLTAQKTLQLYSDDSLSQVEKLRSISAYSFTQGAISLFELLDAQRAYNDAVSAYNRARADYQNSLWQLEQAIGTSIR